MNLVQSSLTVGAVRAAALSAAGSPPRRTWASHSCASERACSTVSSPYWPKAGLRRSPAFVRYWSMNTLRPDGVIRSEEHTSELQSLMRIPYDVFCLKKKNKQKHKNTLLRPEEDHAKLN